MERILLGANAEDMEGENPNRERISLDGIGSFVAKGSNGTMKGNPRYTSERMG